VENYSTTSQRRSTWQNNKHRVLWNNLFTHFVIFISTGFVIEISSRKTFFFIRKMIHHILNLLILDWQREWTQMKLWINQTELHIILRQKFWKEVIQL